MMSRIVFLCLFLPLVSLAQLDSNSVTVSATRNVANLQADQAIFGVFVDSPLTTSFSDVLAAVAPVGVTAASFSGVGSTPGQVTGPNQQPPATILEWAFALTVPISKIKDTTTALANLQQSIAAQKNGLSLSFSVQGTQVSQQLLQSQTCSIADLLTDARAQAQKLADAAGQMLGPILAMSSGTNTNIGTPTVAVSRLGLSSSSSYAIPSICSVAVKFGLTRY